MLCTTNNQGRRGRQGSQDLLLGWILEIEKASGSGSGVTSLPAKNLP